MEKIFVLILVFAALALLLMKVIKAIKGCGEEAECSGCSVSGCDKKK